MNHPEATQAALNILRSGEPFQWHVITKTRRKKSWA
jgi:hypothetical protein